MAPKEKMPETPHQAHTRIRAAAIAHFAGKPHGANDRLEWIRREMCMFRDIPYVPPKAPLPPVAMPAPEGDPVMLGVMTQAPDADDEL